jgi:hypothetical protein
VFFDTFEPISLTPDIGIIGMSVQRNGIPMRNRLLAGIRLFVDGSWLAYDLLSIRRSPPLVERPELIERSGSEYEKRLDTKNLLSKKTQNYSAKAIDLSSNLKLKTKICK